MLPMENVEVSVGNEVDAETTHYTLLFIYNCVHILATL